MSLPPNRGNGHGDSPADDETLPRATDPPAETSEISTSSDELARLAHELGRLAGPFTV